MVTAKKKDWFVSFRVATEEIKNETNKFFNDMADQNPDFANKGEALYAYMKQGQELFEKSRKGLPPQSAQEVLDEVNCSYLEYQNKEFKCFDKMDEKKKPTNFGDEPDKILIGCEKCKLARADKIREQYRKKLRGKNIKGILQLINLFQKFAEDGVPSTVYFCNRIPDNQIFTGLKTMECTMYGKDIPIDRCKEEPCKYFEEYTIAVQQEFPEQTLQLIEDISKDYKRIEDLSPKKQVESEQVEPDV